MAGYSIFLLAADRGAEFAAGEADGNIVVERDLIRRTQHFPIGIVGDGVAALENPKRAALFELQFRGFEALALRDERAPNSGFERDGALLDDVPPSRHSRAQIERRETHLRGAIAAALARHHPFERGNQSETVLLNSPAHHGSAAAQIERSDCARWLSSGAGASCPGAGANQSRATMKARQPADGGGAREFQAGGIRDAFRRSRTRWRRCEIQ